MFLSLILLSLINVSGVVHAQQPCQITCDKEMPVCSQESVTLSVPDSSLYRFLWTPGNFTTHSITVKPMYTTTFHVYVTDTLGMSICDNSFTVDVLPHFHTTMQQLKLTCTDNEDDNGNTAQIRVNASGEGLSFVSYDWEVKRGTQWSPIGGILHVNPDNPNVLYGLQAYKWYRVAVEDDRGCVQLDSIYTRGFPTPAIVISCLSGDTITMQNAEAIFSFENLSEDSIAIDNFFWILPDGQTSVNLTPKYTFTQPNDYLVSLTIYDDYGCDTTYIKTIKVVPYGLNENSSFIVKISPNPTNGNVIIKTDDLFQISIFNAYGQLICEDTSVCNGYGFDFSKYGDGIFILQIKTSKGMVAKRLVVTK